MSSHNKKIASLLAGASLLTMANVQRASAVTAKAVATVTPPTGQEFLSITPVNTNPAVAIAGAYASTTPGTVTNGIDVTAFASATAQHAIVANANALAFGIGQLVIAPGATAKAVNSGTLNANATAHANNAIVAVANALGDGIGQIVIATTGAAAATATNQGGAHHTGNIEVSAKATASTAIVANANALAFGIGQIVIGTNGATAKAINSGAMNVTASANANHAIVAVANAGAIGVGQIAISGGAALATATNTGDIKVSAKAAASTAIVANANALAFGVGQVVIGTNGATAKAINSGAMNATATANANNAIVAVANAGAIGVGQIAISGGAALATEHNTGDIEVSAKATASTAIVANANALAFGVGQVVIGTHATAKAINSGTLNVTATANANNAIVAVANAGAIGVGQIAISTGTALATEHVNTDLINANANAHASGILAIANAGAFGVNQFVLAGTNGNANVDNEGTIDATANADAHSLLGASIANGLASGVGQIVIAGNAATDSVTNNPNGKIQGVANARANGTTSAPAVFALANAGAFGVNQVAVSLGGTTSAAAVAKVLNGGSIDATANANATGIIAIANGLANGVGQVAVAFSGGASASIHQSGHIHASGNANASGVFALANAGAFGANQFVFADTNGTANVNNDGTIDATANAGAHAFEEFAIANSLASGVGQVVIADGSATDSVANNPGATIQGVAHATANGGTTATSGAHLPAFFALANAAAGGVNQLAVSLDGTAVARVLNGGPHGAGTIDATATAKATGFFAIANGLANGVGQVAVAFNGGASASVFNESRNSLIKANANANASGVFALANAGAFGVNQFVFASTTGTANVDNEGTIEGIANAHADGIFVAANGLASGVGQVVIAGGNAKASVLNDGKDSIISGSAHATAHGFATTSGAIATPAIVALAKAAAFGVGQVAIAGTNATASVTNNAGAIDAKALANASGNSAIATAFANAVGQIAIAPGTALASVFNESKNAVIKASANANATGSFASANAVAIGVGQVALAGLQATATVHNEGQISAVANAHAASATATGGAAVAIANGVGQLAFALGKANATVNNTGAINVKAKATATGIVDLAVAQALGVGQAAIAFGTAAAFVNNGGTIAVNATASAHALGVAGAFATAVGVAQLAAAGSKATATVVNDGNINVAANALASAPIAGAGIVTVAAATAVGVRQAAFAGNFVTGGTAAASVVNNGNINVNAAANARGVGVAVAFATAVGVSQSAAPIGVGGSAIAKVSNNGLIGASAVAHALPQASTLLFAQASALATGVRQAVTALGPNGIATASVVNGGTIKAKAQASASGSSAVAGAFAFGVSQSLLGVAPTANVLNNGAIQASAGATARGFAAVATATAVGVSVNAHTGFNTLTTNITNNGLIEAKAVAQAFGSSSASARAAAVGIFVQTDFVLAGSIANHGSILASAIAAASASHPHSSAFAVGIWDPSRTNNTTITNTGLIRAYAQTQNGGTASATGILITGPAPIIVADAAPAIPPPPPPGLTTIINEGGTIWAGESDDGGHTVTRGNAINTYDAPNPVVIELQGGASGNPGHIFGDIYISDEESTLIDVTHGTTFFEGTISSGVLGADLNGTLDIHDGGKLVLCQEGWQDACDPNGWGNANWDPQKGVNDPSLVFVNTFMVGEDGTIVYQLTPNTGPLSYPQVVANSASLSGTLVAQYLPGFYADHQTYENIIVAGNQVGGPNSFHNVLDNSLLLNTTAIYDGNTVDLNTTRTAFNAVGGLTKNENSVAGGLEHVYSKLPGSNVNPAGTNAFDQMVARLFTIDNKATFLAVLDQLSGAQYAQQLQSTLWSLRPLNESVTDRMNCSLNQPMVPVAQGYSYGCFRPGQFQTWARVWGGWNHNDGDVNAPGYDEQQWAIWGGGDYGISDTFMIGFAGGFFRSNMDFNNFGGVPGGKIEYDGGQIAGYAAWDTTIWYNRAIVSGGWYSGDSQRNFALQSSPVDPNGSPDSNAVSFYDELGRRFGVWTGVTLTPFAGVTVSHAELDGFTENDHNSGAALKVAGSDGDSVASLLGLRFSGEWWGVFKPQVALAWEHEFDDTFQTINASFAGAPSGSNFKVRGTDLGEETFVVDAGASYALGLNNDLSFRYVGRFLDNYDAQSVMGRWTYKWGGAPVAVAAPPPVYTPLKLGE